MAELTREAAAACRPEGRPLYAGHADLDWPDAPHLVMWHALSLLREHRGDGHICALVGAELSGLEALVTHTATGQGFVTEFAQASRGWSDEEWKGAVEALTARGLLGADGALTPAGDALRAHVEEETDRLDADPWRHLGDEGTEEVVRIGTGHDAHGHEGRRLPPGRRVRPVAAQAAATLLRTTHAGQATGGI